MSASIFNIETKIVTRCDEDGKISFAIKATVENNSDDDDVMIELQGLDRDGFEIYYLILEGRIPTGTSRVLTTKDDYVDKDIYDSITEWQVK